ncbi:MAG: hypothetical protein CMJ19_12475 [Phycisphaeraceae bacterium]|mgnify:CR=1 FL=1|nr:hypothetical protein [Phycisphaeraceae bacterium]
MKIDKDLLDDGRGDWRLAGVERLAHDVSAACPGGPSHKAGSLIVLASLASTADGPVSFPVPSPVGMALQVALTSANLAYELKTRFRFETVPSPMGLARSVTGDQEDALFDYFQHCMVAVTFSFQSVESFANFVIANKVKSTMAIDGKEGRKEYNAYDLQRRVSTAEKLATVLPTLLSRPTPKGTKIWQEFVALRRLRDSTVHMKSLDQYGTNPQDSGDSLYFNFFNCSPRDFPRLALDIAEYFTPDHVPRWLRGAREALTIAST